MRVLYVEGREDPYLVTLNESERERMALYIPNLIAAGLEWREDMRSLLSKLQHQQAHLSREELNSLLAAQSDWDIANLDNYPTPPWTRFDGDPTYPSSGESRNIPYPKGRCSHKGAARLSSSTVKRLK